MDNAVLISEAKKLAHAKRVLAQDTYLQLTKLNNRALKLRYFMENGDIDDYYMEDGAKDVSATPLTGAAGIKFGMTRKRSGKY